MTLKVRSALCLEKGQLKKGTWYKGHGRNANIALWNGDAFLTYGAFFKTFEGKVETHWDDGGPFQPFEEI